MRIRDYVYIIQNLYLYSEFNYTYACVHLINFRARLDGFCGLNPQLVFAAHEIHATSVCSKSVFRIFYRV